MISSVSSATPPSGGWISALKRSSPGSTLPLRDDRDEEQHHRHRRRADRLELRGRGVELEHPRQRRGLRARQFRALEADVEQLRDHRERDRVGELAHQLDRLAFGEWRERAVDDRGDALADPLHRPGGEEAVDGAPQPRVGRRVAHQQRAAPQLRARSRPAEGGEQLGAVARVRAPLGAAQDGCRVLVGEHEVRAEPLVPLDGRPRPRRVVGGVGVLGRERPGCPVRHGCSPPGGPRRTRGRACPSR